MLEFIFNNVGEYKLKIEEKKFLYYTIEIEEEKFLVKEDLPIF